MNDFESKTLRAHLARGFVGFSAVGGIPLLIASELPVWVVASCSMALIAIAFVALRGCPMCWTIGLIETAKRRLNRS